MERTLRTIKGASRNMPVGAIYPIATTVSIPGDMRFYRVTRVDADKDAVYGVVVPEPEGPWWRANKG